MNDQPVCNLAEINPTVMHMLWVLEEAGYEARLCGGAVRDIIQRVAPKDWDIATTATPEQVTAVMGKNDHTVIPTGLQHGTVTVMFGGTGYEITTLRSDIATDGRHATVEYTTDWVVDSNRRDFTYNAMYLDSDGVLYDYHGGVSDLRERNTIFVGDPAARIQEDYLRILRYYRFVGKHGCHHTPDIDNMRGVIKANVEGLMGISGERIWSELRQIVMLDSAKHVIHHMIDSGVISALGMDGINDRLHNLSTRVRYTDNPAAIIGACYSARDIASWIHMLRHQFHASNDDIKPLQFVVNHLDNPLSWEGTRALLGHHSKGDVLTWVALTDTELPMGNHDRSIYTSNISAVRDNIATRLYAIKIPPFPVSGHEVMALGVSGPMVGTYLNILRDIWSASDFAVDEAYLLQHLQGIIKCRGIT